MSTKSVPISKIAKVTPAVDAVGGAGIDVVGLVLTQNTVVPIGEVLSFEDETSVADYFGSSSAEFDFAETYFTGYDGAPQQPAALRFAQFPLAGVAPYLQGGTLATPLATLQALNGTITLDLNGEPVVSSAINLNGAASYSAIAALIQTGLGFADAEATASIAANSNVLTVTAVASGALAAGQGVVDPGATLPAGLAILEQLTGTAGEAGTYQLNQTVVAAFASGSVLCGRLTVAYSSTLDVFTLTMGTPGTADTITVAIDGTLSTALKLTAATGAVVSPGSGPAVAGTFMASIVNQNSDWATFTTLWEAASALKVSLAQWVSGTASRYAYICWSTEAADIDPNATTGSNYEITQAGYGGVYYTYAPVNLAAKAAMIMGSAASIDFDKTNGRQNFALLTQTGLQPDVTDSTTYDTLLAKGINMYVRYGNTKTTYNREYPGAITGKFLWMDSYINQIWMNDGLQTSLFLILADNPNVPYVAAGYALINEGLSDDVDAALNFGAIRASVTLSAEQISAVNTQAGVAIASQLQTAGWVLVIQQASALVRAARGTPPILFFYTDGQSVQALALTSTEVQ